MRPSPETLEIARTIIKVQKEGAAVKVAQALLEADKAIEQLQEDLERALSYDPDRESSE